MIKYTKFSLLCKCYHHLTPANMSPFMQQWNGCPGAPVRVTGTLSCLIIVHLASVWFTAVLILFSSLLLVCFPDLFTVIGPVIDSRAWNDCMLKDKNQLIPGPRVLRNGSLTPDLSLSDSS